MNPLVTQRLPKKRKNLRLTMFDINDYLNKKNITKFLSASALSLALGGCNGNDQPESSNPDTLTAHSYAFNNPESSAQELIAPGAPGQQATWAFAGKTGIGSSYEEYVNGEFKYNERTGEVSKVWFSVADGVLTETMWGLIHEAQLKDLQFALVSDAFVDYEITDTTHSQQYLYTDDDGRPLSPAYRLTNKDKEDAYELEKHLFTDPDAQVLWQRSIIRSNTNGLTPIMIANPHIANTGSGDFAKIENGGLSFSDGDSAMHILFSVNPTQLSVGFKGESDAYTDLQDGKLDWHFSSTGQSSGNVLGSATFSKLGAGEQHELDIIIGFGATTEEARDAAANSLKKGYSHVLANYNGSGDTIGWKHYIDSLDQLAKLTEQSTDQGKLAYASALVLKIQEDKTHAGALIASLSNPWGDTVSASKPATGYKAVWPRDFYQCAMAFIAMGDPQTAKTAFDYLEKIQVEKGKHGSTGTGGWFYQKAEVDGTPEWVSVQLDQTGMPLMLAWQLWKKSIITDNELKNAYETLLKPAANFLVSGGEVDIDWNKTTIAPPQTQQERWEEQSGYSPSTTAAVIAGLVSAADIAYAVGASTDAERYLDAADAAYATIDNYMYTTKGVFENHPEYYLRVTQNENPNDNGPLLDRNGRGELNELEILDGGFLELVRYGVKPANSEKIKKSLAAIDDTSLSSPLQVRYEFKQGNSTYSGWRRYGNDGYGEDINNGANYGSGGVVDKIAGGMSAGQRGRVWPFLTGERGHYEIAAGANSSDIQNNYIAALEYFANQGLMLPEQVWDGVGEAGQRNYAMGDGTSSATPLAWAHAEYIKLLRSNAEGQVFDQYPSVVQQYQAE